MKRNRLLSTSICIFIAATLSGCAASYKTIAPSTFSYGPSDAKESIDFDYQYNVLSAKGNKKYAKREGKFNTQIVAVRVTNNTDKPVKYDEDYSLFANGVRANLIDPEVVKAKLRQRTELYLLYLPLMFLQLNRTTQEGNDVRTESTPIGPLIATPIIIGNMAMAASANKKFLNELTEYNIKEKVIAPGETFYGLIAMSSRSSGGISVEIN